MDLPTGPARVEGFGEWLVGTQLPRPNPSRRPVWSSAAARGAMVNGEVKPGLWTGTVKLLLLSTFGGLVPVRAAVGVQPAPSVVPPLQCSLTGDFVDFVEQTCARGRSDVHAGPWSSGVVA